MNPLESQLTYPFGDALPLPGTVRDVAPGVRWLRMELPFALDHINLWLLQDAAGWSVIDCGIANDATRAAWEQIFAGVLDGLPIVRVIATHYHPDHVGLAAWLCTRWNAPLCMTTGEYSFARLMSASLPGVDGAEMLPHFRLHGVNDPAILAQLAQRTGHYARLVPTVPNSYRRLQDGQTFSIGRQTWRVITGCGHSPEHASLYCADLKLLISGDMVLPRISTNVSVSPLEPEANPVQLYLDSLARYAHLPPDTLVLPAHGRPFCGLHTRIDQLRTHHQARLAEVVQACASPQSAADIVPLMFRRALDTHQLGFALGEALAHLHKLWFDGILQREMGTDGTLRFQVRR